VGPRERGFTLLEIAVALGILAVLLVAGTWAMALHPAALRSATDDLDAALASAKAVAASSGNGATLVFAPRSAGGRIVAGFSLRIYRGRPNAAGSVTSTNVMELVADATVREKTLGAPPFSLFIDSAGNASGAANYPTFDAGGEAVFGTIAREPSCPAGGFTLTLTNPQATATATRVLPCAVVLRVPLPAISPTPSVPIVTPSALLFHWPDDAQQQFVATEWGYTHWFASTTGFQCGGGVALYPDVLPSPYSAPGNAGESQLPPQPPADTPYSYPNSGGGSTNDAPALFLIQPQTAGTCAASVQDDDGQRASASVDVMGWLSASYGGATTTHVSMPLTIPASALPKAGSSVTLALAKTFDSEQLQPRVAFTGSTAASCAADLAVTPASGSTPGTPSQTPATASVTLAVAALPPSALGCAGVIYDHYTDASAPSDAASEAAEGISFTATLGPAVSPLSAWPAGVVYALAGETIAGGCHAIAYSDAALTHVDANDSTYAALGAATDASGCYDGAIVASESGYAGSFTAGNGSCNSSLSMGAWSSPGAPTQTLQVSGGAPPIAACAVAISSSDENASDGGARSVAVSVNACSGKTTIVSIGSGCTFSVISGPNPRDCVEGAYEGLFYQSEVSQNPALGTFTVLSATSEGGGPTTYAYLWTRNAPGNEQITVLENETICTGEGHFAPYGSSTTTLTFD
jgi:prepilin-type N-terminal cleavage/methylation domain-containing protein